MNFQTHNKESNYVSVNKFIPPKNYNGVSVYPPNAVQRQSNETAAGGKTISSLQTSQTGLPDNLKTEVENRSGFSMDDVRVHYNSSKPAQMQALAYTQGTDIHVAPGQERYLSHEAWHVVQQMQGRVQPTFQMKGVGVGVNDDPGLEQEADEMGGEAMQQVAKLQRTDRNNINTIQSKVIQKHALIGAMIKGQDNPTAINAGDWKDFDEKHVFDKSKHRGNLYNAKTGATFEWEGKKLSDRIETIRKDAGFEDKDPNFVVVANVNTYKTPGIDARPNDYANQHLQAFGTGWTLEYNLNPLNGSPDYSSDYNRVLDAWKDLPQNPNEMVDEGNSEEKLGEENAKQVLRHLTKKYWVNNKNFVIPHRGLRNLTLKYIHDKNIQKQCDAKDQFVSIITLDDDLQIQDHEVVRKIMDGGEKGATKQYGIAFSSTGYIYNMVNNLLEYTASILSHIGGRVISQSYPSEPGLTITYHKTIENSVWQDFLLKSPWGEENSDLTELKSYGRKQNKARVESKEGRAFAHNFSEYLYKHRRARGRKDRAANKVPIRGLGFFSVDMSSVAKKEILKNNPGNLKALKKENVFQWLNYYIKNNKYHPIGGESKDAKSFRAKVLPVVAENVYYIIQSNMKDDDKRIMILRDLEGRSDDWYHQQMSNGDDKMKSGDDDEMLTDQDDIFLCHARRFWDLVIKDIKSVKANVDEDDINEALEKYTDNPYSLDYIENGEEYQKYIEEIKSAKIKAEKDLLI